MFPSPFRPHLFFFFSFYFNGLQQLVAPCPCFFFFPFLPFFSFFLFFLPWIIAPISTLQLFFLQLLAMAMVVQATTIVVVIAIEQ
jgi:hypothetical protein